VAAPRDERDLVPRGREARAEEPPDAPRSDDGNAHGDPCLFVPLSV